MNFAKGQFYCRYAPRAVLKVTGEDALSFLQGQFSQDIREGQTPAANYGLWLNEKGKVQGDSVIWRDSAELCRVFSWSVRADELRGRFDRYIIADDVELEDETALWRGWVAGAEDRPPTADQADVGLEWGFPSVGGLRWRVVVAKSAPAWPDSWNEVDEASLGRWLIEVGEPQVPADIGAGDLPQEGGLERIGVSFRKGCYLGQEVMARIDSLGRVRRQIVRVRGTGEAPVVEEALLRQGDRKIGVLRSRAALRDGEWGGLAMVSLAAWQADSDEPVLLNEGPEQVRPISILGEINRD